VGERFPLQVALAGTGSVEGVVRDGAGRALAGVRVVGGSRWGGAAGTLPAEALSDTEGRYRLTGLEAGMAYLTAKREGAALGASQPVQVREGETVQADFTLQEVGYVEGRVRTPEGRVPEEALEVRAFAQERSRLQSADIGRAGVQAGRFALTLPAGRYGLRVVAVKMGLSGRLELQPVTVEAGRTVQVELTQDASALELRGVVLEPEGGPSADAELTLSSPGGTWLGFTADGEGRFAIAAQPGDYALSANNGGRSASLQGLRPGPGEVVVQLKPGASVRGQVVHASGAPVRGFRVRVAAQGPVSFGSGAREFPGDRFELPGVPVGRCVLVATTEEGAEGRTELELAPGASAEVKIVLRTTASVSGRIVDEAGRPVTDAQVSMREHRGFEETGADGRFSLERIPAGEYTLRARAQDRRTGERQVTLGEGQRLEVGDLVVRPEPAPDAGAKGVARETR
jgi:hypothetical protein